MGAGSVRVVWGVPWGNDARCCEVETRARSGAVRIVLLTDAQAARLTGRCLSRWARGRAVDLRVRVGFGYSFPAGVSDEC